ncbi:hypothetical protein SRHO_G00079640 [Serrasalmus rhombeus]
MRVFYRAQQFFNRWTYSYHSGLNGVFFLTACVSERDGEVSQCCGLPLILCRERERAREYIPGPVAECVQSSWSAPLRQRRGFWSVVGAVEPHMLAHTGYT